MSVFPLTMQEKKKSYQIVFSVWINISCTMNKSWLLF